MAKFMKRPEIVEAVSFVDRPIILAEIADLTDHTSLVNRTKSPVTLYIHQPNITLVVELGDYIVKDSSGHISSCEKDEFYATYGRI